MKPPVVDRVVQSTMEPVGTVHLSIDSNSIQHIISILTDLYSDPIMAVIREYSTNALDSHVESGNTAPIEVTSPSTFDQTFSVRDYGTGLDVDDIYNIYSMYGASTKRESNDVTGMLGLGCKSGLTYADAFTITAWKHGVKTVASVYMSDTGVGAIDIIDTVASDEPSGVLISIPAKRNDIRKFDENIKKFFSYWTPGTVVVNGKAPEHYGDSGQWVALDDKTYINKTHSSYWSSPIVVVMGSVPYEISNSNDYWRDIAGSGNVSGHSVVHFANIGDVQFAPSRESLMETPATKQYVIALLKNIVQKAEQFVKNAVANSSSGIEAMSTRAFFYDIYNGPCYWNGKLLPDAPNDTELMKAEVYGNRVKIYTINSYYWQKTYTQLDSVFVYNWPKKTATPLERKAIKALATNKSVYLFHNTTQPDEWVKWIDWNVYYLSFVVTYKAEQKAKGKNRSTGSGTPLRGVKEIIIMDSGAAREIDSPEIDPNDNCIIYTSNDFSRGDYPVAGKNGANGFIRDWRGPEPGIIYILKNNGYRVLNIPANRHAKFMREFPNTEKYNSTIAHRETKLFWNNFTDRQKQAFYFIDYNTGDFDKFAHQFCNRESEILDPDLREVVYSVNESNSRDVVVCKYAIRYYQNSEQYTKAGEDILNKVADKYLFLFTYADYSTGKRRIALLEHLLKIANMIYTTSQEEGN